VPTVTLSGCVNVATKGPLSQYPNGVSSEVPFTSVYARPPVNSGRSAHHVDPTWKTISLIVAIYYLLQDLLLQYHVAALDRLISLIQHLID